MKRVGFLFNHDQIHQIAHSLPIAQALARLTGVEAVVAVSNERIAAEIERLNKLHWVETPFPLQPLSLHSSLSRGLNAALGKWLPSAKLLLYRDNLDFFRSLDALVVTERTSLILKSRYGLDDLKIFLADHGAGDRAVGFGESAAQYDHILAAGPKIRERMIADAGVAPDRISVTGYPKFDFLRTARPVPRLFDNDRPTVLYNPHVSPHLSSWYDMGRDVLEWFYRSKDYNLIFAPHVMLFERKMAISIDQPGLARRGEIDQKFAQALNIHVDTGSEASTDMSYTRAADVYLGDASSQIYEFLVEAHPCVFLNPRNLAWQGDPNFAHWNYGPVIGSVAELAGAMVEAQSEVYRQRQIEGFAHTFDLTETPSGERAALRIFELLGGAG